MPVPRHRRHPVRAKKPRLLSRLLVSKDRHASFAGRQVLVGEEAEAAGVAEAAARHAVEFRAEGMCSVLDYEQPVFLRGRLDRRHIDRGAAVVHDHDCSRARRDEPFDFVRVDREVVV